jgi:hypothetical protein
MDLPLTLIEKISQKKGTSFTGFPHLPTALGCSWLKAN